MVLPRRVLRGVGRTAVMRRSMIEPMAVRYPSTAQLLNDANFEHRHEFPANLKERSRTDHIIVSQRLMTDCPKRPLRANKEFLFLDAVLGAYPAEARNTQPTTLQ